MKDDFVSESRQHWPVAVMCETLEVSRSGYYDSLKTPPATHDLELLTRMSLISALACGPQTKGL